MLRYCGKYISKEGLLNYVTLIVYYIQSTTRGMCWLSCVGYFGSVSFNTDSGGSESSMIALCAMFEFHTV